MHVNDLRGTISIAAGSTILHLVQKCTALGISQQQRMAAINVEMKEFQRTNGTEHRMPELRVQDLKYDHWAMLTGKVVKAANTRAMLPFLQSLANTYFQGHEPFNTSVRKVFDSLMEIQRIMYTSGTFLSDEAKQSFQEAHERLGRHWQNLRHLSNLAKMNFWQVRPKLHYTQHFPAQARLINPRAVQNYAEESLIGRVAKVWRASANGPYADTVQLSTLARLWTGFELRMSYEYNV